MKGVWKVVLIFLCPKGEEAQGAGQSGYVLTKHKKHTYFEMIMWKCLLKYLSILYQKETIWVFYNRKEVFEYSQTWNESPL